MVGRRWLIRSLGACAGSAGLAGLAGCTSAAATLGGVLIPRSGYRVYDGFAYGDDARQRLDVYRPDGLAAPGKVVVFFYGGSWRSGARGAYRFVGEALASRGFVVVIPDYRLYPQVRFPAFVEDGARAVGWAHERIGAFGGDGTRIFVMGHSAGAHIAALLAIDRRYLRADGVPAAGIAGLIGLAGPYAFDPLAYDISRDVFAGADDPAATRPLALVSGDEPPALLLHGADDRVVLPVNSQALAASLRAHGGETEWIAYPDTGHIDLIVALASPFRRRGGVRDRIASFIDRH